MRAESGVDVLVEILSNASLIFNKVKEREFG